MAASANEGFYGMPAAPLLRRLRSYALLTRLNKPIGIGLLLWPTLWALFGVLVAIALILVMQLNATTVKFSLVGAALTVSYPFMKRFFALPQFWLGAAFGWAVPMAFVATLGEVPRVGWIMFIVTVLWAGIYDTQYAMVDRDDDLKLGVHSTAIAFGDLDKVLIGVMQLMVLGGLVMIGRATALGWPFFASLAAAAALFLWQQWLIRDGERDGCFKAFLNNNWVGLVVFAGIFFAQ
jgi:4-hydroxybenzoate polyprenyltransferase